MSEPVNQIRLASSILRKPQVFDGLGPPSKPGEGPTRKGRRKSGAATGGLLRDVLLFAAWKNQRVCELRLPEFCEMMQYDNGNLTRSCTPEEVEEIRRADWPEEHVEAFSNMLGLALVRLMRNNLIVTSANKKRISNTHLIEHIDLYEAHRTGTLLTFTLSPGILSQNRREFQSPDLQEYLSLRTESKTRQEGHPGHPDDPARRIYLRLTWLRQYYDYLVRENRLDEARSLLRADKYEELVQVAGLGERRGYWPERRVAAEVRKLLGRVGQLASIRLAAQLKGRDGDYQVKWQTLEQLAAVAPEEPSPYTPPASELAPERWDVATAAAPAKRPARRAQPAGAASAKIKPKPAPVQRVQQQKQPDRAKLLGQLEDADRSLRLLDSDAMRYGSFYKDKPQKWAQDREAAQVALHKIQAQLQS